MKTLYRTCVTVEIQGPDADIVADWGEKVHKVINKETSKLVITKYEMNTLITITKERVRRV